MSGRLPTIRATCHVCAERRPLDELLSVERRRQPVPIYLCRPGSTKTACFGRIQKGVGVSRVRSAMTDVKPLMGKEDR